MDETGKNPLLPEPASDSQEVLASPAVSPSTKPKNVGHSESRSPKPKDGEKIRQRLAKSMHVWKKESLEKRRHLGPIVARHSLNQPSNLKIDITSTQSNLPRRSLVPTSPTYESAFKRQVVNRPLSPGVGFSSRRPNSFNKGRFRPPSPSSSIPLNSEEVLKKRMEKARRAKLYLLQQAGPNTFIIGGGESAEHKYKVTIGRQMCSCGKGFHCIHILFVMVRVFELPDNDPQMHSKELKNFEVESLFKKYERRRKERLNRARRALPSSSLPPYSATPCDADVGAVDSSSNDSSQADNKMEVTCPICLLDLQLTHEFVTCEHCHNKLHHACMEIWYQLVKKQGDVLTCPLCRLVWDSNVFRFENSLLAPQSECPTSAEPFNASPNSLGVSPVSGFTDIEPTTLLPRSQPIPQEHAAAAAPWVEMFGEDLIGCLFIKNAWVMRETALRHLSRAIIMLLSHPSEQDITSLPIASSSSQSTDRQRSRCQSRIEYVLDISCQILAMMMMDPVYKVYVSSLRSLRTMLSYCTLPDVTKLQTYMRPVIQNIVLKCADGNRKTNQLSVSTLIELSKDQGGELAIGRELANQGQTGLGGCMYVLDCCVSHQDTDTASLQWLNGRLLIMNQILEEHADKFSVSEVGHKEFTDLSQQTLLPMIEFAVKAISKVRNQPRTLKYSKKVITRCARHLSGMPGMNTKIRGLLSQVEPDLRGRLEREIIRMSITAHQSAIHAANSQSGQAAAVDSFATADVSEGRVGSPILDISADGRVKAKQSLPFGSIYQASVTKERLTRSITVDGAPISRLPQRTAPHHRRSDSYSPDEVEEAPRHDSEAEQLSVPEAGRLSAASSIESVEADYIPPPGERDVYASEPEVDRMSRSPRSAELGLADDADLTLTGPSDPIFPSDSEGEDGNIQHRSPTKLSRRRFVMGSKPQISVRSEHEPDHVEFDGDIAPVSTDNQDFDVVDGLPHSGDHNENLAVPPLLQSHESLGFEHAEPLAGLYDGVLERQPIERTDSESCTDISQSVSLSISGGSSSDDENEDLSDSDHLERNARSSKNGVPFKEYKPKKHVRSKTDPFRINRAQSSKSLRYHSDPTAGGDSTTASSAASTPRTPPAIFPSPSQAWDEVQIEPENGSAPVKPVSRALTFTEPPVKVRLPARPHSMRAARGANSQLHRSRLPARSKTAALVAPISDELYNTKYNRSSVAAAAAPPSVEATGFAHLQRSSNSSQQTSRKTSKWPTSSGGGGRIPAAVRALTPPNSPLGSPSVKTSTPCHTPPSPTFSPPPPSQAPLSPRRRPPSRSPSPQGSPVTAVVRPQVKSFSPTQVEAQDQVGPAPVFSPPQVVVYDSVEPSRPIQRQTSSTVVGGLLTSTSGSSDDHKTGSDSLYADDLSDSAVASPYEKPVSFKSEVSLFSPRDSSSGDNCHCKDEVELEEAIALAKAMEISTDQTALPQVPGLSMRREEETITIHVQQGDQMDGKGNQVEYLEDIHWKRGMRIGTGAFSTCYQCRDVKTGIIMAVKQISFCRNSISEQDSICAAVKDEIRMMATLNHSNIVRILGATQTGAHFNMFVEWMPGGSVSHLLERYGSFSEPVITSYTQQVLMGLAYLHDHQILHRDMKGANLLVDSTGRHLRIGDFGACAQLASSMTGAGELRGQLLGTIAFMAPEVLRGEHYGRACDVWSVGCVIIEMVTSKPPWNASNVSNHLKLIFTIASANASPPIPENLPPGIKDLMLRCLELESKNRPPAKELLQHPLFTQSYSSRRR